MCWRGRCRRPWPWPWSWSLRRAATGVSGDDGARAGSGIGFGSVTDSNRGWTSDLGRGLCLRRAVPVELVCVLKLRGLSSAGGPAPATELVLSGAPALEAEPSAAPQPVPEPAWAPRRWEAP